jgi:uncharacterized protein involved in outer membrane biogenesis
MSIQIKRALKVISLILVIFTVCILALAYLRYRDLKNSLITKIADEATSFIGQKVEIRDLFIGPASEIILHDISVKNPAGSISGELLRIKKLRLKMKYAGLTAGRLDFKNITVYSPELTITRDKEGRMNISEKLMDFFKRKPTVSYRVDELSIESGIIDFNKDKKYRCDNVNMHLKNLKQRSRATLHMPPAG